MGPLPGGDELSLNQGPPASEKQVAYLQALLRKAGFDGFRDARRPLGLTQRQGSGKFTRTEASALIERLLGADGEDGDAPVAAPPPDQPSLLESTPPAPVAAPRLDLRHVAAEALAAELARRGWNVTPPPPQGHR
ncbi:MAG: hypothetical protein ACR2HP_14220 [Ilumatobacteraceae bacterium]